MNIVVGFSSPHSAVLFAPRVGSFEAGLHNMGYLVDPPLPPCQRASLDANHKRKPDLRLCSPPKTADALLKPQLNTYGGLFSVSIGVPRELDVLEHFVLAYTIINLRWRRHCPPPLPQMRATQPLTPSWRQAKSHCLPTAETMSTPGAFVDGNKERL